MPIRPVKRTEPCPVPQAPEPAAPAERVASSRAEVQPPARAIPQHQVPSKPKRGHATKDDSGKWQPTGDYAVGFGRPPVDHQFKGKPGPGRPRKALTHDGVLRQQLEQKRKVRVDGQQKSMTTVELVIATLIKNALQGQNKPLQQLRQEMARLYPEVGPPGSGAATLSPAAAQVLDHYFGELGLGPVPASRASAPPPTTPDEPE